MGALQSAERMTYKLHRAPPMIMDSTGVDYAVCFDHPEPIMRKSRYRYQLVNTISRSHYPILSHK
jgi:conjugal transfer pilus assembly protein TraU